MLISVQVRPHARKSRVIGLSDGVWQVMVAAPPVQGKANAELVAFLSETLGIGKSGVAVVKGHTSRRKVIRIEGLTETQVTARLSASAAATR